MDDIIKIHTTFTSILILASMFNIVLNVVLIYLIIKKCDTKSTEIKLILGLCLFEIVEGCNMILTTSLELGYGYTYLTNPLPCQVLGFIIQICFRLEILIVTVLSLLRYLMIFFKFERNIKFWVSLMLVGSIPSISIFLYGAVIGDNRPTVSYTQCLPYLGSDKFSITMMLITSSTFLLPCWTTTFCYFAVGWKCNKQLNKMKIDAEAIQDSNSLRLIRSQKIKLFVQLTMVFFIYNCLFMLSYITMILKFAIGFKRTPILDGIILFMINSSVCLNPLITVSFQPEVNNEFLFLLVTLKAKLKTMIKKIF
jgi:hypothetical protein